MAYGRAYRSIVALSLILCLSSAGRLLGQGSLADYKRAEGLRSRTRGKVFGARVQAKWLSGSRFWYRIDIGPNQYRFILVDASKGKRQDAFDHGRLATALADATGKPVHADHLPFRTIRFSPDGAKVLFSFSGKGWDCDLKSYVLAEAKKTEVRERTTVKVLPFPRTANRNGKETTLQFINRTSGKIKLYWVDRVDEPKFYKELGPGQRYDQHTFGGHVWLATNEGKRPLGVFEAKDSPGVAVIDGTWRRGQKRRPGGGRNRGGRSPDGRWQARIVEHNVVLNDLQKKKEIKLSSDGKQSDKYLPRFVWSPDSKKLVVMQERPGQKRQIHFIESSPRNQVQPKLHTFSYAKPGDKIAQPRPRLFDVASGKQIDVSEKLFANPWSISDLSWAPDSSRFTFLYNQRGHQTLRLVAVDAETGETRPLIDEVSKTFVCYSHKRFLRWIEETGEIIWMSERDGWNHLYLYDAETGEVKNQITQGEWVVRGVDRVDVQQRQIWFRAGGIYPEQDPYHVHYCRVNFDGMQLVVLTEGDGVHKIEYSPQEEYFIDVYSRVDLPPVSELRRTSDGKLICELERANWSKLRETGWQPPLRFAAKGRDGETDIYGVIFRPTTFDPDKKYPVIENIYAGPHSAHVPKRFASYHGSAQAVAELGFIVVRIDGMGTSHRSKKFHDVCWRNLGDAGFPDRVLWMKAAAMKHPWMDVTRVGVYGGSAGGQNAMRALITHGDFYAAAVADCGCHDNRMDKIWWNEQWMGWPLGPHYAESSNVAQAHRMQGKLLLFVGELDRNVDPASTMQVVNALIKADKDFDFVVIPGGGHGAGGGRYGTRRQRDFFVRHLLRVEPRWNDASKTR